MFLARKGSSPGAEWGIEANGDEPFLAPAHDRLPCPGIIAGYPTSKPRTMEADQLNAIENHLSGLAARTAELRRYL